MPQIAQQDYKVIAPKEGRGFNADAAALAELKKSVLNGIAFDCLLKDVLAGEGTIDRVLGIYEDGMYVSAWDSADNESVTFELPYTVTQYQGLAAVQNAEDEKFGRLTRVPELTTTEGIYLAEDRESIPICVDGKYLTITGSVTIEALAIAETGPTESDDFVNITWEDAQKLIGLPLV